MAVIAIFNQKGGVGKTTTTLNLTAALARMDKKPLAIDLDSQAHLTLALGMRNVSKDSSIYAYFHDEKPLKVLVQTLPTGVNIIPASSDLSKIDALFGSNQNISSKLKDGIKKDFANTESPILIDCSPVLGVLSLNALIAADRVLIPVSADYLSLQGANRLSAALDVLETRLKRTFDRKVVITRFDSRRKLSFEILDKLKSHFGDNVICETRIAENVSLAESPARGKDIFSYNNSSHGAVDYRALTNELVTSGFIQ